MYMYLYKNLYINGCCKIHVVESGLHLVGLFQLQAVIKFGHHPCVKSVRPQNDLISIILYNEKTFMLDHHTATMHKITTYHMLIPK